MDYDREQFDDPMLETQIEAYQTQTPEEAEAARREEAKRSQQRKTRPPRRRRRRLYR